MYKIERIKVAMGKMSKRTSCGRAVFPELPVRVFEYCSQISANSRNYPTKTRYIQWSEAILLNFLDPGVI